MLALKITNLTKTFYTKQPTGKFEISCVLNNCNLEIKQSEIFGIAGLNGIGKSTLIKIILGLLKQDKGEIQIFNIDNNDPKSRNSVCYLPEKFQPSPYLTGYEFLSLSLSFYNKKISIEEINNTAKILDLDVNALPQMIKKYSKGMCQKLGLLYCLLSNAKLLILDEPMTGLDPKARVILKNVFKTYVNNGNTIFFSSHILDDMEEICDTLSVLHNGDIKFCGTPNDFNKLYNSNDVENAFLKCIS